MSRYYTLKEFELSDFKDDYGNVWCNAVFEGFGEPVRWVVKDPEKVVLGKQYYGRIDEVTSKAGKPYNRFYKEQEPEDAPQASQKPSDSRSVKSSDTYWDDKDRRIQAQFAIKTAAHVINDPAAVSLIESFARELYDMVERVSDPSGYEKAKSTASKLPRNDPEDVGSPDLPEDW